jgi:hypothetical protein
LGKAVKTTIQKRIEKVEHIDGSIISEMVSCWRTLVVRTTKAKNTKFAAGLSLGLYTLRSYFRVSNAFSRYKYNLNKRFEHSIGIVVYAKVGKY